MRRSAIHFGSAALALGLLVAAASPAGAQRWLPDSANAHRFAPRTVADRRISLEQAVAIVQQQTGGRVLDARAHGNGYRVKVLTRRGEVLVVFVDGQTGATR